MLDTVENSECLQYMKTLPNECVDLIVTSPPYAEQRLDTYGGVCENTFPNWFSEIGIEMYRIMKPTGAFVLNIKEHVNNGERSTYVLKTILALSEIFIWNDTFIWNKLNPFPTGSNRRLKDGFEYCYLFVKSKHYKFYPNRVLVRSDSKYLENEKRRNNVCAHNVTNGSGMNMSQRYVSDFVRPSNVISISTDNTNHQHPAAFPIALPEFFIKLLTDENDVVFDPFSGSGTTLVSAKELRRHYIGCEIKKEYIDIINDRLCRCIRSKSLL